MIVLEYLATGLASVICFGVLIAWLCYMAVWIYDFVVGMYEIMSLPFALFLVWCGFVLYGIGHAVKVWVL